MRVFVTGATGFVGLAVVNELLSAGHQVLGLARTDAGAQQLIDAGAVVHRGSLEDLDSLRSGVAAADGVIHTAFIHDFSKFAQSCETDRGVIEAMGAALGGKPMIVTSGIALVAGGLATEDKVPSATASAIPRVASEEAAAKMAAQGAHVCVLRLPPSVHDEGDHGFVPALVGIARQKGLSGYIADGMNRWPSVHRTDAAKLYRLALEQGVAGARYHAVADTGVPCKEIATVIGKHLNVLVSSIAKEDAAAHFTWLAHFFALDCLASSAATREQLGWEPTNISLIEDLEQGHYF